MKSVLHVEYSSRESSHEHPALTDSPILTRGSEEDHFFLSSDLQNKSEVEMADIQPPSKGRIGHEGQPQAQGQPYADQPQVNKEDNGIQAKGQQKQPRRHTREELEQFYYEMINGGPGIIVTQASHLPDCDIDLPEVTKKLGRRKG